MTAATSESPAVAASSASPPDRMSAGADQLDLAARTARDRRVERVVLRSAVVGALTGASVCAPLYVGFVFLALHHAGTALAAPLGMSIGLGIYAGLFLGGSIGTLIGSKRLEHHEHDTLPALPSA